jgi:leukotriene-A4 hydrolase
MANSYANVDSYCIEHMHLEIVADFQECKLKGAVTHDVSVLADGCAEFILDTRDVDVRSVVLLLDPLGETFLDAAADGSKLEYRLGEKNDVFGSALYVTIPQTIQVAGARFKVRILFSTAAGDACTAAQWLPAEQTAGKDHPYLFTQCQVGMVFPTIASLSVLILVCKKGDPCSLIVALPRYPW